MDGGHRQSEVMEGDICKYHLESCVIGGNFTF